MKACIIIIGGDTILTAAMAQAFPDEYLFEEPVSDLTAF